MRDFGGHTSGKGESKGMEEPNNHLTRAESGTRSGGRASISGKQEKNILSIWERIRYNGGRGDGSFVGIFLDTVLEMSSGNSVESSGLCVKSILYDMPIFLVSRNLSYRPRISQRQYPFSRD